jgi:glycerophosphoryl diester phosphodiesterase
VVGLPRPIWEVTYDEIRDLDAGSWFSPDFADERIATLEQALDVARGRIGLNIELNSTSSHFQPGGTSLKLLFRIG